MIDPKKVRLMTKLAVYEEGPGKKDLRINGYSKRTYVNIKQLESVIAITAAYILAMVLYCFGIYTDIISRGLSFPYHKLFPVLFFLNISSQTIWRLFLEVILGIGCCYIYRFFRGIGDVSRIEKVSFEDDEYFYYVKAVPKIKVTEKNRNVTNIKSEEDRKSVV